MARTTVDVSLRADVSQLLKEFQSIEGTSKKEAKAMLKAFQKSYKDMEKASKIAANTQAKAMKKSGQEAGKTAGHMTDQWQRMATESASIFGSGAGWLGDLEGTFDIARQSSERLGGSLLGMGTIGAAAMVGAIAAVRAFNDAQMQLISDVAAASSQLEDYVSATALSRMQDFTDFVKDADAAITMLKFGSDDLRGSLEDVKATQVGMAAAGFPDFLSSIATKVGDLQEAFEGTGNAIIALFPPFWLAGGALKLVGEVANEVERLGNSAIDSAEGMRQAQEDLNDEKEYDIYLSSLEGKAEKSLAALRTKDERADKLAKLTKAREAEAKAIKQIAQWEKEAVEEVTKARELAARVVRLVKEDQKELNRITKDEIAAQKGMGKAYADVDTIRQTALSSMGNELSETDRLTAAHKKDLATIKMVEEAYGRSALTTDAATKAKEAYKTATDEANDAEQLEKLAKLSEDTALAASVVNQLADAAAGFAQLALDKFTGLADARTTAFEDEQSREAELHEAKLSRMVERGDMSSAQYDLEMKQFSAKQAADEQNFDALTKREQAAVKRAFAVQQAAAVAGVMMQGAQAYVAFLTAFAPLMLGAPAAAAAVVLPFVGMQLATIAAQKPPEFPGGGMVSPDHMLIGAQSGEAVMSRRGVHALGGASAIESLNRGVAPAQANLTANIILDRRVIGKAISKMLPKSSQTVGRVAIFGGV
tara:strand:+ start:1897 stop:4023 length:2127 start_codon:yes stop_codon:yes gene_type:complete